MLPEVNKLRGKKDFEKVEKEGKVFQSQNFGLAYIARKDKKPSRFGFIISTKISKDATERNRVKRILREAVRQSLFGINPGFDVIFLTKLSIMRIPTDIMMKEVKTALRDTGISK